MSVGSIVLAILCQVLIVPGQIMLKLGLTHEKKKAFFLTCAITSLSIWFFLWLGLLANSDLSRLYPFEGLNPAMMAIGSWLILKEKLPPSAWIGLGLVCIGVSVVAGS